MSSSDASRRPESRRAATVLLSTFQGERYLESQLASLFGQDWPDIEILVRDDGSCDGTWAILDGHAIAGRLAATRGVNIGPIYSFFTLLDQAAGRDFVLFADQDDVWNGDKVRRAMTALEACDPARPALYCSRLDVVDADLNGLGQSPCWPLAPAFGNALVENIATGCTIALNRAAVDLLRSAQWPRAAVMHDWWCYLVVAAFGTVIYDPGPSLMYRQHGTNSVGMAGGHWSWLVRKIRRQMKDPMLPRCLAQAQEFQRLFGTRLAADKRDCLRRFLAIDAFRGRVKFVGTRSIHRQFVTDTLALKGMVLLHGSQQPRRARGQLRPEMPFL